MFGDRWLFGEMQEFFQKCLKKAIRKFGRKFSRSLKILDQDVSIMSSFWNGMTASMEPQTRKTVAFLPSITRKAIFDPVITGPASNSSFTSTAESPG